MILISELITDHTSILLSNNLIRVNAYTRKCWKYVSNPKHDALKYLFDLNILLQLKFSVPLTNVFMNFDHDFFFSSTILHHSAKKINISVSRHFFTTKNSTLWSFWNRFDVFCVNISGNTSVTLVFSWVTENPILSVGVLGASKFLRGKDEY